VFAQLGRGSFTLCVPDPHLVPSSHRAPSAP